MLSSIRNFPEVQLTIIFQCASVVLQQKSVVFHFNVFALSLLPGSYLGMGAPFSEKKIVYHSQHKTDDQNKCKLTKGSRKGRIYKVRGLLALIHVKLLQ